MIKFINPIGFLSLLLLSIPIIIHLLSKKKPDRIKVGSIRWIKQSELKKIRKIRFKDPILFFCRSSILALLSIALSIPEINCTTNSNQNGWILIEPSVVQSMELANESPSTLPVLPINYFTLIDSLTKIGYEIHLLESGFRKINRTSDLTSIILKQSSNSYQEFDLWSLLSEADQAVESDCTLFVFAEPRLSYLKGTRPELSHPLKFFSMRHFPSNWIQRVSKIERDSLFISIGYSDSSVTMFSYLVVPIPETSLVLPQLSFIREKESIKVVHLKSEKDTTYFSLSATAEWEIWYEDETEAYLPYLQKALEAIRSFSENNVEIRLRHLTQEIIEGMKEQNNVIRIILSNNDELKAMLVNRLKAVGNNGQSSLTFLTIPSNSDLFSSMWIESLSKKILPLKTETHDKRWATSQTLLPNHNVKAQIREGYSNSLFFFFWVLAMIVFLFERWIAT